MTIEFRCEICNINEARYRCKYCGRNICGEHMNMNIWICKECEGALQKRKEVLELEVGRIFRYGLLSIAMVIMIALGFSIILINIDRLTVYLLSIFPIFETYKNFLGLIISLIFLLVGFVILFYFIRYVFRVTTP